MSPQLAAAFSANGVVFPPGARQMPSYPRPVSARKTSSDFFSSRQTPARSSSSRFPFLPT